VGAPEIGQTGRVGSDFIPVLIGHLGEGRSRAGSLPKVVVDNRAQELSVVGFLCLRQAYLHLVALKGKQPRELLWTYQEMLGERFQAFVREELDKLGNSKSRGVAVERVHQADGGRAFRVLQSEVDGGWASGIVTDRDDLLEPQGLHDRFEISKLLFKAVVRAIQFVWTMRTRLNYRQPIGVI
jgi:hypothetical protein